MNNSFYNIEIIVAGKPITKYLHEGKTFVEGRRGSNFSIQFTNNFVTSVLAVPSVDGLSTLDGQPASEHSQGYIVAPHTTIEIPGWTLDPQNVAKFFFQHKQHSYAAKTTNTGTTNTGVIGLMVFGQGLQVPWQDYYTNIPPLGGNIFSPYSANTLASTTATVVLGVPPNVVNSTVMRMAQSTSVQNSQASWQAVPNVTTTGMQPANTTNAMYELGTGFGSKQTFDTKLTTFDKGLLQDTLLVYYDSLRNLEKRGIQVVKREQPSHSLPNAFPGVGCKPPANWQG